MQYKYKLVSTILTLMLTSINIEAYVSKDFSSARSTFLQVEADLKKGKTLSYQKNKHALQSYPLYPYLKYEYLKASINNIKHSEVSAFVKTYHDSPLANNLRNEWLKSKAAKQQWQDFLTAYDVDAKNDIEMQCHYHHARLNVKGDKSFQEHMPQIWLNGKNLPKSCDPIIHAWKQDGQLSRNLIWQRIKLSINNNETRLAKHLAKNLSNDEEKLVDLWIRTHNDPALLNKPHYFNAQHSAITEMIIHAIGKIAKTKPEEAVKLWQDWERRHEFHEHHWGMLVKEIALSLARKKEPNAEKWLETVPPEFKTKEVTDAQLKLAVSKFDWSTIAKAYLTLPEEESQTDKWQYWYARSLEMLGNKNASQEILYNISTTRGYYGFLASTKLLKEYSFNHEESYIAPEVINKILLKPAVIRAHELKQLGRAHSGKTEWVKALEDLSDNEKLAAAFLAQEWEMPNWSIVALANASNKNDLILRFPKNFAEFIHKEAKNRDIDPEVLFAITRQESAFIPSAKSPAGALGLMQLMPQTGKMVAKAAKEPIKHTSELLKPEKNIRYGSHYLRMMLDQNQQNHALAAASYNAGPHRVTTWIPEYDMPVDCWVETIPFKETREYVQNFLTYTVIYQRLLGKTPKMSKFMPIINGVKRTAKIPQPKTSTKKKTVTKSSSKSTTAKKTTSNSTKKTASATKTSTKSTAKPATTAKTSTKSTTKPTTTAKTSTKSTAKPTTTTAKTSTKSTAKPTTTAAKTSTKSTAKPTTTAAKTTTKSTTKPTTTAKTTTKSSAKPTTTADKSTSKSTAKTTTAAKTGTKSTASNTTTKSSNVAKTKSTTKTTSTNAKKESTKPTVEQLARK